jgi:cell division protein FtsB
MMDMRLKT